MKRVSPLMILFAALLFAATAFAQDFDTFSQNYNSLDSGEQKAAMAKRAVQSSDDIEYIRKVQNLWMEDDYDTALAYFEQQAEEHPQSAQALYLYGRMLRDLAESSNTGRKVIELDPSFIYGYRLLVMPHVAVERSGDVPQETVEAMQAKLPKDVEIVEAGEDQLGDQLSYWELRYQLYQVADDFEGQLEALDKGSEIAKGWGNASKYAIAYAGMGDFDTARDKLNTQLDESVAQGQLEQDMRIEAFLYYYVNALFETEQWDEAIRYLSNYSDEEYTAMARVDLARAYMNKGNTEQAWGALRDAVAEGYDTPGELSRYDVFDPLRESDEWDAIVARIQQNRADSADERRREALADKMSMDAPELPLRDTEGNEITLADLKGKVVVIDFWATWCGPCRMAMPEINQFTRQYADKDVEVISLNVWENAPEKAKQYMKDNDYAMRLMWANGEEVQPTELFGVTGIPTLVVIDRDGMIRYKEVGYEEGLQEKLGWFADDLL